MKSLDLLKKLIFYLKQTKACNHQCSPLFSISFTRSTSKRVCARTRRLWSHLHVPLHTRYRNEVSDIVYNKNKFQRIIHSSFSCVYKQSLSHTRLLIQDNKSRMYDPYDHE